MKNSTEKLYHESTNIIHDLYLDLDLLITNVVSKKGKEHVLLIKEKPVLCVIK